MAAAIGAVLIKAHTSEAGASAAGQLDTPWQPAKSEALDVRPAADTSPQAGSNAPRNESAAAEEGKMLSGTTMPTVSALLKMQEK